MLTAQSRLRADLNTAGYYAEGAVSSSMLGIDAAHGDVFKLAVLHAPNTSITAGAQLIIDPQGDLTLNNGFGNVNVTSVGFNVNISGVTSVFTGQMRAANVYNNVPGAGGLEAVIMDNAGNFGTAALGGITWETVVVAGPTPLVRQIGVFTAFAGTALLTLPALSVEGDTIYVCDISGGVDGWQIGQNAGQQILIGNNATTVGVAGGIGAQDEGASVMLVCAVANTLWVVVQHNGNIGVA